MSSLLMIYIEGNETLDGNETNKCYFSTIFTIYKDKFKLYFGNIFILASH